MNKDFRRLWAAQATSALGSRLTRTALPVMAVLTIDANPTELGVMAALSVAPGAAVGLLAGGAIDRSKKRPILMGADLFRFVLLLSLPLAAWLDVLSMPQLYVVAALAGIATVLFSVTDNTFLPVLVSDDKLVEANARLETTEAIAEITGPGVAGVLIDVISAPLTIMIDAVTYAVSAIFLSRIETREETVDRAETTSLMSDVADGARAVWGVPLVRQLFLAATAVSFFAGFFFALYIIFALKVLELSPWQLGWIIGVGGVGALLGAALAGRFSRARRAGPVLLVLLLLSQLGDLFIPLAQGSLWLVIALLVVHQLVGDGFRVAYAIFAVSLRQVLVPRDRLGRANAVFQVAESIVLPIGALLAGALASAIGVREAIWVGVVGGLTAPLFLLPALRSVVTLTGQSTSEP